MDPSANGTGDALGEWETLRCERRGTVALLTLARPDRLNVMNLAMREQLAQALERVRDDSDVHALVITGEGGAFSAGGDVNEFVGSTPEQMHALMREKSHHWFKTLWALTIPTVAAVNGVAAGGGVNLALACDFVLAGPAARFGQTFSKVGLMPDLGGLFVLPRTVGLHRAKALALGGELIGAEEARELGFVHEVVAAEGLLDRALTLGMRLADGPRDAYAATKAVLNRSFETSMEELLQMELYAQSFLFSTGEHRARLGDFLGD